MISTLASVSYSELQLITTLNAARLAAIMAERSSRQIERSMRQVVNVTNDSSVVIGPGEREMAQAFITKWFENEVHGYLTISDPFFGPDDLEILQVLQSANPGCSVRILTNKKRQDQLGVSKPWDETYRGHWRIKISDQEPPDTEIVIIGTRSQGESPIHDRWWLTEGSGLRVGTSLNALGLGKISELSTLDPDEAKRNEQEVNQYLDGIKKEHDGQKLVRNAFTL